MKKCLNLKMNTTISTTTTDYTWTYNPTTEPVQKGVLVDNGRWLQFGQKRFEFIFYDKKEPTFNDGRSFVRALEKRGFVQLGSGTYSTVLGKPGSDRVIKVTHKSDGWIDYVTWGAKMGSPFVPKVFSYKKISGKKKDFYVAIMERLEYTLYKTPGDHALSILPDLINKGENPMAARFIDVLAPGLNGYMKDLRSEFPAEDIDLHRGNYMIRKDGSFVVTDPIAAKSQGDYNRLKAGDFSPAPLLAERYDRFLVEMCNRHRV